MQKKLLTPWVVIPADPGSDPGQAQESSCSLIYDLSRKFFCRPNFRDFRHFLFSDD